MPATKRLAISYTRFSSPKQERGDSEDRQERLFRDFCQRHNLTPLAESFADRGKSGYKDEHRKSGRLGQLIALAKDGRFEPGTVIVVEAWDRLGRLRPDRQTDLLAELLRTGIDVGVCRLNEIFTEEDFGTHKWTTLAVFVQLAFQESKQKAERVAASWESRRKKARTEGRLLTSRLPAWMESIDGKARLIPERAAIVRRIFQLAAAGYGQTRIVGTLVKESVPAFGKVVVNEGRGRSQFCGRWTRPYIHLILNDRRAMGEFQPRRLDGTPDGAPIANFLPAAITEDEFLLARAGQDGRLSKKDSMGRRVAMRHSKYVNVFKGLLRHARDGEGWLLHNKGTAAEPELILVNAAGNGGRAERCYTFPYHVFEESILGLLREVNASDILPREREQQNRADVLRAKLANVREDIARIQADIKEGGYSKALSEVLRSLETNEEQVAIELQEELSRTVKPAERAWRDMPNLIDLIKDAKEPDEMRLKLRPALRSAIEEMWILIVPRKSHHLAAVQVYFTGGARRDYLIHYWTAGYRRTGGWKARSIKWPAGKGKSKARELDLRNREDAATLAELLAEVDLKEL